MGGGRNPAVIHNTVPAWVDHEDFVTRMVHGDGVWI